MSTSSSTIHQAPQVSAVSNPDAGGPSVVRTVFASSLTPTWSSALVLAACFVLPLCLVQGCQGPPTPFYPVQCYTGADSFGDVIIANTICWPYLFGAVAGIATLWIAVKSARGFKAMWWLLRP